MGGVARQGEKELRDTAPPQTVSWRVVRSHNEQGPTFLLCYTLYGI